MRTCEVCGARLDEGAQFCPSCDTFVGWADLRGALDTGRALAVQQDRPDLARHLDEARERLAAQLVPVAVVGEFKRGKSTLVNALLRTQVCPVDADVVTAVPTLVRYGEMTEVLAHPDPPGEARRLDLAELTEAVSELGRTGPRPASVEVRMRHRMLRSGCARPGRWPSRRRGCGSSTGPSPRSRRPVHRSRAVAEPDPLTDDVTALLHAAEAAARTEQAAATLADARRRLAQPLRVAVAGKLKAGKSTLLNALLGEELAATDAGECTKIVTWYRGADQARVVVHAAGTATPRPYDRSSGALQVDLGVPADEVDHVEVEWPTRRLADLTVIDTPGIASLSTDVSARTYRALAPDDDRPAQADAVIYLLRHAHAGDMRFLESFHDDELAHATPMNAVGVLARADEIGSCRLSALDDAHRVARRYQRDPRLQRVCPVVVPVSGLLGMAGETLREEEFRALALLAAGPAAELTGLLMTADRFARRPGTVPVSEVERSHLLDRLGLFGVRLAVELLRDGTVGDATALRGEFIRRSGLAALRTVL
ncbi:MAG TPA: dynamin family protein, partial [Pseudonocardia sp.]|nr:dynamin family protein [Pseudonocardia sp.]